ncbi:hypothetical protein SLS54_002838 [Diplodia seriata]
MPSVPFLDPDGAAATAKQKKAEAVSTSDESGELHNIPARQPSHPSSELDPRGRMTAFQRQRTLAQELSPTQGDPESVPSNDAAEPPKVLAYLTSTSDPAEYYGIHTGAWINWSDGRILGSTITLTRRDDSVNYAQDCYTNVSSVEACKRYVKPQLPWSTNRNASCPFGGGICRDEFGNLELDSGYIDSNDHLGHNDPPEMRFRYRHLLKCAPLITEGYRQQYTYTSEGRDSQYMRYYYGKGIVSDHTYEYPMPSVREFHDQNFTSAYQDYTLATMPAVFLNQSIREEISMFDPIPELRQLEGDITLYFLSPNFVMFSRKMDDPWYSAHTDFVEVFMTGLDGKMTMYRADEPASVLACVSQYQICNPNQPANRQCTALGSIEDIESGLKSLHFNDRQGKVIEWFGSLLSFSIYTLIGDLGSSVLTSRYSLSGGLQAPIPNNQWQLEVEHWFTIWLANLQQLFVSYATGPSDPEVMRWVRTPKDDTERNICRNQKIVTTAYTNFNTLGLCLTFAVGTLIIVVSYTIEPVVSCIQKRRTLDTYSRLECVEELEVVGRQSGKSSVQSGLT